MNKLLMSETPIQKLNCENGNDFFIKRDDLLPFSFGGNKARKAVYFFEDIEKNNADCIVTYGSSSSNHCRIIANTAASMGYKCVIISPAENEEITFNLKMMNFFGADIIRCPITDVSATIDKTILELKSEGFNPYFIMGGGHGNLGTRAYVDCFSEITKYERQNNIKFDYIFHASGTGTTQAGLICGKLLCKSNAEIIGISIARSNPRGGQVVLDSVNDYMKNHTLNTDYTEHLNFVDDYVSGGYGKYNSEIDETIRKVLIKYGIPLNRTYTGKAFWGMKKYLEKEVVKNKKILFIHTGGTPLFFDYLKGM